MAFFSVVIPLYNKSGFIEQTMRALLAQTFTDFEVIVVNDGSTDDGGAKVKALDDPRIRYYERENKGVAAARNFGITMAHADFVAFLDADDYWYPDFLQAMCRNIIRFPEEKVFSTAIEIETARKIFPAQYSIHKTSYVQTVDFFEASSQECVIWTSAAVFHKSVFEACGSFDPKVRYAEDTDLWMRIGLQFPVVFNWAILARYVYDPASVSRGSRYIFEPGSFAKYADLEKTHRGLRKFLDLNRFSAAIKSKLAGDRAGFKSAYDGIDLHNLSAKKRTLLHLTRFQLQVLVWIKTKLAEYGLGNSIFK